MKREEIKSHVFFWLQGFNFSVEINLQCKGQRERSNSDRHAKGTGTFSMYLVQLTVVNLHVQVQLLTINLAVYTSHSLLCCGTTVFMGPD
jgi:hypothetical protein